MKRTYQQSYDRVKSGLEQLFKDAGYVDGELLDCLEELRTEIVKLKSASTKPARPLESMSSKLKDALRE
ncbi:hypothetical protein [Paenibacillus cremeus]|uniref:Uncharacterized protein n=1 Tax=Paenibacillus cremeus TaxID=2163881 RepID=A0A559KHE7_9BACL|nr:hypothetical protein [Paenibacillus cremeus]TVY11552.1 hypothetical protein FPZ49_02295 [Paenibacillus cremeus]